jgi:cytochrome c
MKLYVLSIIGSLSFILAVQAVAAEGNVARGQRVFGACAACHSLRQDQNLTGPSLANIWNRKAGSLPSFTRYSEPLKSAHVVWNDRTLDEWVKDPQHLIPGNQMTFAGIRDPQPRADLLAFLKQATQQGAKVAEQNRSPGGMMNMMGGGEVPNLKKLGPAESVKTITYCKDTYTVTTADGATKKFWERNLRLKTDASEDGPERNAPALVRAGMMGDRADVIFAQPSEISSLIAPKCE